MTRSHVYDPPPHLDRVSHRHTCPNCRVGYWCYAPNRGIHFDGYERPCGSGSEICVAPKPTTKEKESP